MKDRDTRASLTRASLRTIGAVAPSVAGRIARRIWFTPSLWGPVRERAIPPGSKKVEVPAANTLLSGWEVGDGQRTALLVHGWAGSSIQYRRLANALSGVGYRAVVIDLPAHGSQAGGQTDLYSMTNAVIDAARGVGPVDLTVAHSLGAIAATRAMDHGLETKRLVLVAPGVFPRHAFDRFVSDLGLSDRVAGHVEAAMNERFGVGVFDQVGQEMLDARPPSGSRIVRGSADELVPWNDVESLAESWEMPVDVIEAATHNSVLGDPEAIRIVLDAATTMDSTPSDRMDVRLEASR